MSVFISGQELSRQFYHGAVRPILDSSFAGLQHSAALFGRGSEVLGFDDEMSRDHDWGARVLLFLREEDHARHGSAVEAILREKLPSQFQGYPTNYSVSSVRGYFLKSLDLDIEGDIEARDWLTISEQQLLMMTAGTVYHDGVGLQAVRDRLAYYPRDVWLYLLVASWWRIHPEANLVGRVGFVGDELGSSLLGSRLVHDLMQLCFLMEKQYAPYSKWFSTAFSRLSCAAELSPILWNALRAQTWPERENALMAAYRVVAAMHNALHITESVSLEVHQMWDRPFKIIWGDFPGLLTAQIQDPTVKRIAERWPTGGIDQVRELLMGPPSRRLLLRLTE